MLLANSRQDRRQRAVCSAHGRTVSEGREGHRRCSPRTPGGAAVLASRALHFQQRPAFPCLWRVGSGSSCLLGLP